MRIKLDFIPSCRSLSWHLFAINLHDPQFYFRRKVRMRETESQILWLLRLFPWTSFKVVWVVEYIAVFHKIHRVLGSCGFQWCVFHSFSKNSLNIQLMGWDGCVLLVRPSRIPRWISKIIFVLGSYEFLAMLEGKDRKSSFF